jgi:hypothetical protein
MPCEPSVGSHVQGVMALSYGINLVWQLTLLTPNFSVVAFQLTCVHVWQHGQSEPTSNNLPSIGSLLRLLWMTPN